MKLCIKVRRLKKPYDLLRTLRQNTVLNINELKQLVSEEQLLVSFPNGDGVHFDFSDKSSIIMRPRKDVIASLGGEKMQLGCEYRLKYRDVKILTLRDVPLNLAVIRSDC